MLHAPNEFHLVFGLSSIPLETASFVGFQSYPAIPVHLQLVYYHSTSSFLLRFFFFFSLFSFGRGLRHPKIGRMDASWQTFVRQKPQLSA